MVNVHIHVLLNQLTPSLYPYQTFNDNQVYTTLKQGYNATLTLIELIIVITTVNYIANTLSSDSISYKYYYTMSKNDIVIAIYSLKFYNCCLRYISCV